MSNKNTKSLLPYPVIVSTANGNVEAVNAVLKYYDGYIASLSVRQLYDDKGNSYTCVDEGLRRRLETKLIIKILTFRVA